MNRRGFFKSTISVMALAATLKFTEPAYIEGPIQNVANTIKGNDLDPDFVKKLSKKFLEAFETERVKIINER